MLEFRHIQSWDDLSMNICCKLTWKVCFPDFIIFFRHVEKMIMWFCRLTASLLCLTKRIMWITFSLNLKPRGNCFLTFIFLVKGYNKVSVICMF